jgi:hypothetical protein
MGRHPALKASQAESLTCAEIPTLRVASRADGSSTTEPGNEGLPAPEANREPTAVCPYREHALISHQEYDTWNVLLACQGQLRLAPGGHIIGINMNAALRIGAARGADLAVLSELLPVAEAGLVETFQTDPSRP